MDYEKYLQSKEWKNKKLDRLAFDNWQCAFCHKPLSSCETHHIKYTALGHEDIEKDIISLCHDCHKSFHDTWNKTNYWEDNNPYTHWKTYSLSHTAKLCHDYLKEDFFFGGKYNLCSQDTIYGFIDQYFRENGISESIPIFEQDIKLYVRNKRYEILFNAVAGARSLDESFLENMLDKMFGKKGKAGSPNPNRAEAKRFFKKHKLPAMRRIYKESETLNSLMREVRKLDRQENMTND